MERALTLLFACFHSKGKDRRPGLVSQTSQKSTLTLASMSSNETSAPTSHCEPTLPGPTSRSRTTLVKDTSSKKLACFTGRGRPTLVKNTSSKKLVSLLRGSSSRCLTASRDNAEANIFGSDFCVSTEYLLEELNRLQDRPHVTKLELEDVFTREIDRDAVQMALQKLLARDSGNRTWQYIKFVDEIVSDSDGDAHKGDASLMLIHDIMQYGMKQERFWSQQEAASSDAPAVILFQAKVILQAGMSCQGMYHLLRFLRRLSLSHIEFEGALYGIREEKLPLELADLMTLGCEHDGLALGAQIQIRMHFKYPTSNTGRSKTGPATEVRKTLQQCLISLSKKMKLYEKSRAALPNTFIPLEPGRPVLSTPAAA